jgi:hypothetical protein
MALEWLRRNMPAWDEAFSTYLFTQKPIIDLEDESEEAESGQMEGVDRNITDDAEGAAESMNSRKGLRLGKLY